LADGAEGIGRLVHDRPREKRWNAGSARALLRLAAVRLVIVDTLLEDRRGFEHHHATRRDRHLGAGLRIAADTLAFLAYDERAERRELHRLAPLEAIGDLLQHEFHQRGRFGARQADLLVHRLAQISPRDCLSGHRPAPITASVLLDFQRYELDYRWSTGG